MIRLAAYTLTAALFCLGVVHLGLAAAAGVWNQNLLWFTGTGTAILVAALANLAFVRLPHADLLQRVALLMINVTITALFALAWAVLPEPQVLAGLIVCVGLTVCASIASSRPKWVSNQPPT